MISTSALIIVWHQPEIEEERWEFFNHPTKQEWYCSHGVVWDQIVSRFDSGALVPYPRGEVIGTISVALSYHRYEEYQTYLARAKRGYRKNYSTLEELLQSEGSLKLKAPIVIHSGEEGLLYSGYRRLCLAWNYGMVPYVWLVRLD
ncbi:MAG: hypothetical protein PHY09_05205 [Desulfuromonadaceae bacterium]|nr:hypothetical protein [Desulfuromonadaceae bacterium]MDD5106185.1 hypothetical protein [Desulfuromonadaceae bacterium]